MIDASKNPKFAPSMKLIIMLIVLYDVNHAKHNVTVGNCRRGSKVYPSVRFCTNGRVCDRRVTAIRNDSVDYGFPVRANAFRQPEECHRSTFIEACRNRSCLIANPHKVSLLVDEDVSSVLIATDRTTVVVVRL